MKRFFLLTFLIVLPFGVGALVIRGMTLTPVSSSRLTVMTYNIGVESPPVPTVADISAVIKAAGLPDVLLIQDTPWRVKVRKLASKLGYEHYYIGRDLIYLNKNAILSKYALTKKHVIYFYPNNPRPSALSAIISIPEGRVLVVSVHLDTLRNFMKAKSDKCSGKTPLQLSFEEFTFGSCHERSVKMLLSWIDSQSFDHALIGGDFNSPLLSKPIRMMNRNFTDVLWPELDYFLGTKVIESNYIPDIRIDYLFHTSNLLKNKANIFKDTPGDHYPIYGAFGFLGQ